MAGLVGTLRFHTERLARPPPPGHALATDLAELLVRRGTPFREAHEVVGHLVVWCQVHDCELAEVSDEDLDKVSPLLTPDVRDVLTVQGAIAARASRAAPRPPGWPSSSPGCGRTCTIRRPGRAPASQR